ncbi:bifunctional rhamnulose-1-phosphate aldolase/short-chain dehydrogenase [Niveispirillum fermenti]|uniref:bifunctional rhamnulose-1-phosphate aldolase/short-chain dehydrogenase n=1 Tax=Niveispirillum fermenti TaxID=1233113 RepID=UPI003A8B490A
MSDIQAKAPIATKATPFLVPCSRWESHMDRLEGPQALLLRSNLLGADLSVTNYGGGNTSAKLISRDPLTGADIEVLWVKGSGGDLGSMKLDGFATLEQRKLLSLEALYRGQEHEDEMVGYLPHCTFDLNPRAASIDTPLHAYLPFTHVDHVHPDAIIALAAARDGEAVTREVWGGAVGWLSWQRPGFALGLRLRDHVARNPGLRGVMLAGHGIICWGDTARSCYENTIALIADAAHYLNERLAHGPAFGGVALPARPASERSAAAARLLPKLRGLMQGARGKIGHFADDAETLEFVGSRGLDRLAAIGTSCPDHFLRTKIVPMVLDPARLDDDSYLAAMTGDYRSAYAGYYQRCAGPDDPPMRDANPVVVLVPGIGRLTLAADKSTARIAGEFYANAINVMRGAEVIGGYVGLDEREAFRIEYWALEEAKLRRMPAPRPLVGKIALVTGGAGGIGAATAARLAEDGACIMLVDRDADRLREAAERLEKQAGADRVRMAVADVTREAEIEAAFTACAREFGGLDILVANAGIASSAALEATTTDLWRQNFAVLAEGYFLTARAAFTLMKRGNGGSIVFIGSKNGVAAATNAAAYASAKAASLHLARCLALEGAPFGIRVNTVNPDAVIKGSHIWDGAWRRERAGAHGIDDGAGLEAHYRDRSMLKREVLPEDVAQAVHFFASDLSAKSTGNMINVDAGNAQAFTR